MIVVVRYWSQLQLGQIQGRGTTKLSPSFDSDLAEFRQNQALEPDRLELEALTSDGCWLRDELQAKGIGHLDHWFFRRWEDRLCPIRAAKDDGDVKTTPARTNSRSSTDHLMLSEMINKLL